MKTRAALVMAAIIVAYTLLATTSAPATPTLNPYEKQLLTLVNQQRAKHHLTRLKVNTKLIFSARAHSTDMGMRKYFAHNSPEGEKWTTRIIRFGYSKKNCKYWRAGENIYYGSGISSSPCLVLDAWMQSPSHRAVILTKAFREIGVGAVKTDDGYEGVDGAVWFFTIDLGRRIVK